ncbi:hypothetical protein CHARACLAT_008781 [Characodon lateralis]|uniref:Uncharacterized protein n=1 Tax=Characodon lateralis TaxID=208331 RepID=A0ABU7ES37_9TELE|nr:hypothetical protein [Characodon lateralis]
MHPLLFNQHQLSLSASLILGVNKISSINLSSTSKNRNRTTKSTPSGPRLGRKVTPPSHSPHQTSRTHHLRLSNAERNYDVGDRKLLAIKLALEEWRHWL